MLALNLKDKKRGKSFELFYCTGMRSSNFLVSDHSMLEKLEIAALFLSSGQMSRKTTQCTMFTEY